MAFDIDDVETEALVHRLAKATGLSIDEAIKQAAEEKLRRLEAEKAADRNSGRSMPRDEA